MTAESRGDGLPALAEYEDPPAPRRRRPAPKANPFFRFVFPLIIAALGIWVFLLWREGTKAVLDSTDGELIEIVTDPEAPGYEAFVDPTPTLLVAHVDTDGGLVGVTVLARTLLDNGGQVVLLGADLAADGSSGPTLAERWRSGGIDALEADLGGLFGFGFLETEVVDAVSLERQLTLVQPIPIDLLDDLVTTDADGQADVFLASGGQQIDGASAAAVYGWRNPGEFEANRTERQLDLWQSWILRLAEASEPATVTAAQPDGLPAYLRVLAVGQVDVQILPAVPEGATGETATYALDADGQAWLSDVADRMVPLPVSPVGNPFPSIRLLDGTGERATRDAALGVLADLTEVLVFGNASEFGIERTTITYHRPDVEEAATVLGEELGGEVVFSDEPDQPVDLTVVIGTDWEAP